MTASIQGIPVDPTLPAEGEVLVMTSGKYVPGSVGGGGPTVLANVVDPASVTPAQFASTDIITTGNIATTAGKTHLVIFDCDLVFPTGADLSADLFLEVDGSVVAGKQPRKSTTAGSHYFPITISAIVTGLPAGNHIFKLRCYNGANGNIVFNSSTSANTPTMLKVIEF